MVIKFYLETYGCSLNASDSEVIAGRLEAIDAVRVNNERDANLIVVNTCGVKEPTEDKIIHRLRELADEVRPVIVAGCLPKISYHRIELAIPRFAAMIGPQSIESLGAIVPQVLAGARGINALEPEGASKLQWFHGPPDSVICTVPICEGCLGNCAYCAVKFARGHVKSHSIEDISRIVTRCIHTGYREIRLTSQDAGVFGVDTGESLVDLIKALDQIEGRHRFRLGMFNPNLVLESIDSLVDAMSSEHYFQFYHVPLQSGSDAVLQAMGRRYTVAQWEAVVSAIRSKRPSATIATDIIVGYPGETDQDFEETMNTIERMKLPVVNISKYGDRPGTLASKSPRKVDTLVKKNRSRALSRLVDDIVLETNHSWIGWSGPVLVTERGSRGGWLARNPAYKLVIMNGDYSPGSILDVQITDGKKTHLIGEVRSLV